MNLFVYGTLMDPEIMALVAGEAGNGQTARLSGYVRRRVSGECYPAIVPQAGAVVDGLLYAGLSPKILERLDRFEGENYFRRTVLVELAEEKRVMAQTYVFVDKCRDRLSDENWSLEAFQGDKAGFVKADQGFISATRGNEKV